MNEKVFLVSIFMFTSSLTHADAVQNKINQLFEQGYTHLEVERGTVKSKIVAYDNYGTKIEIVLSNSNGSTILQFTKNINNDDLHKTLTRIEPSSFDLHRNNNHNGNYDDDDYDKHEDDNHSDVSFPCRMHFLNSFPLETDFFFCRF